MSIKTNPKTTWNNRNPYAFLNPNSRSKKEFDFSRINKQRKETQLNYNCYTMSVKPSKVHQKDMKIKNHYKTLKNEKSNLEIRQEPNPLKTVSFEKTPNYRKCLKEKKNNTFNKLRSYTGAILSTSSVGKGKYNKTRTNSKNSFLNYKHFKSDSKDIKQKDKKLNRQVNNTNKIKRSTHLTYINISKENSDASDKNMSVDTNADSTLNQEISEYEKLADQFEESFDDNYSIKNQYKEEFFSDISATSITELAQKSFKKIPHVHRLSISEKGIEVIETLNKVPILQRQVRSQTDIVIAGSVKKVLEQNNLSFTERKSSLDGKKRQFDTITPSRFRKVNEKKLMGRVFSRSLEKIPLMKPEKKLKRHLLIQPCFSISPGSFNTESEAGIRRNTNIKELKNKEQRREEYFVFSLVFLPEENLLNAQ